MVEVKKILWHSFVICTGVLGVFLGLLITDDERNCLYLSVFLLIVFTFAWLPFLRFKKANYLYFLIHSVFILIIYGQLFYHFINNSLQQTDVDFAYNLFIFLPLYIGRITAVGVKKIGIAFFSCFRKKNVTPMQLIERISLTIVIITVLMYLFQFSK